MAKLFANSGDPDQTPHSAASDLGLHCLAITLLQVSNYNGLTQTDCQLSLTIARIYLMTAPSNVDFKILSLSYKNIHSYRQEEVSSWLRWLSQMASNWWSGRARFDPLRVQQHSFVEIDLEIFSVVILSRWFMNCSWQFLVNECAQVLVNY